MVAALLDTHPPLSFPDQDLRCCDPHSSSSLHNHRKQDAEETFETDKPTREVAGENHPCLILGDGSCSLALVCSV